MRTHYDDLQVAPNASPEVIRGAYKYLSQKWHPDKNPGNREEAERILKIINNAYDVLSDPELRAEHDLWIKQQERDEEQSGSSAIDLEANVHMHVRPQSGEEDINMVGVLWRVWLIALFSGSVFCISVIVISPFLGGFGAFERVGGGMIVGLAVLVSITRYSYLKLFHPHTLDREDEKKRWREARERELKSISTSFIASWERIWTNVPRSAHFHTALESKGPLAAKFWIAFYFLNETIFLLLGLIFALGLGAIAVWALAIDMSVYPSIVVPGLLYVFSSFLLATSLVICWRYISGVKKTVSLVRTTPLL